MSGGWATFGRKVVMLSEGIGGRRLKGGKLRSRKLGHRSAVISIFSGLVIFL